MRLIGIGLAVALMAATLWPQAAAAAAKTEAPAVTKEVRAAGMAAAPGLITEAGLDCQLADARLIGTNKDPKTKIESKFYEVACTGNEGIIMDKAGDAAPVVFTCEETSVPTPDGKPNSLMCILPGNLDPKAGLVPYIQKAGVTCSPTQVRPLGHTPTNTVYELVCQEGGGGYIMTTSAPPSLKNPVTINPCIVYPETNNVKCTLTPKAEQYAVVDKLVAQSGKTCTVKDRLFVGVSSTNGSMYYEVACEGGKGYVIEQAQNGAFKQAIDCVNFADASGGGCKLTDTRQAKTEQTGLYTRLAKQAGFDCDVSGYAPFPVAAPGKEVVEMTCSNRPDGGVGVFGVSGGASVVYDCAHSELQTFRCSLTKPAAAYPALTQDLHKLGKTSCTVSSSRVVGVTPDNKGYIEVGCSDGLPGYMIQYSLNPPTAQAPVVCAEAKGIGGGCTLPGNTKGG